MSISIIKGEFVLTPQPILQIKTPQQDQAKKKIENQALSSINLTNPHLLHDSLPLKEKKITKIKQEEVKSPRENQTEILSQKHIENRDPGDHLLLAIKNFKEKTKGQILSPKVGVADSDSDVFFYETNEGMSLVIKPGLPDARISIMAQEVLKIVGLDHTVPTMKLGKIQNIKSSQDLQKEYSIKKDLEGKEFAVEKSTLIPLKSNVLPKNHAKIKDPLSNSYFIVKREGKKIELSLELSNDSENESDNGLNSSQNEEHWIEEFASVNFKLVQDIDGSHSFLAPEPALHSIKVDEHFQKQVTRNNSLYDLNKMDEEDDAYEIIGSDIPGLYQEKISRCFIGDGWGGGLDITKSSTQRNSFYSRIDPYSFIDSFISFMLTRSHDGKIERLEKDSNFLFKVMENGETLKILQIDLDRVMPERNDPKSDMEPHPLRCGLMGFPMVDVKISGEKLLYLKEVLLRCVNEESEEAVLKVIEMYGKESHERRCESIITRNRKQAYREVIEKTKEFLNENEDEITLKNLFYHVFPSYKKHFELLVNPPVTSKGLLPKGLDPQLAALQVGAEPLAIYTNRDYK